MLYKVVLAVTLPYVAGFASSPGGGTPPTTEALVEVMLNDLATSFGQVSTEEKNTAANEILKGNPEIKALLTEMVSKQVGMENWRTTHPEQAASACKPCVHQESTRSFERFLSYESLPDAATIAEKVEAKLYALYNPAAGAFLYRNDDTTLVREMIQLPNSSNMPEDVSFDLPTNVSYSQPSDLIWMTIHEMASLIRDRTISCELLVSTFIDRMLEYEDYLAYLVQPLTETARATALEMDAKLANGEYLGPMMCIPFGLKDHHQVADEYTSFGNILFARNKLTTKSKVAETLMKYGAIPIGKMTMGSLASGAVHGWGMTVSPYLNDDSGGSSTGSGSAAALRALPFAISEETWGSISSPARSNYVSGHIPSYGVTSKTGAGLLSAETDHIGFHTRYLKDFGLIMNYMRTGDDPFDGDSVAFEFEDPAKVNLSSLNVLIVVGSGNWTYNTEEDEWDFDANIEQSGTSAWKWPERSRLIMEAFDAAGIKYEAKTTEELPALWEDYSLDPLFPDPEDSGSLLDLASSVGGGAWGYFQQCDLCLENSRFKGGYDPAGYANNLPMKSNKAAQYAISHFGRRFLNDPFWSKYDAIIHTGMGSNAPGYHALAGNFEQWVRTAKTFVVDYLQPVPCYHPAGGTVHGGLVTITSLPWKEAINFAIGTTIQEYPPIKANLQTKPNEAAIKAALGGRSRCAIEYFDTFTASNCPDPNSPEGAGTPENPDPSAACITDNDRTHMNEEWASEPYVPPHMMEDPMPDRAIYKFSEYEGHLCEAVCPYVGSYCEFKGITCSSDNRRKLQENKKPQEFHKTGVPKRLYKDPKSTKHEVFEEAI